MISAEAIESRLASLDMIGHRGDGFHRLAWTLEDREAAGWFAEQAAALELRVERDSAGNLWAVPDAPPPWWAVGSHLDTVAGGGRYDGALGVVCALAIAERIGPPIAVISFADEEGARYNTPTFGSRALVGLLDVDDVLARRDVDGVTLADALRDAGVEPREVRDAPKALDRLQGFVEIHIDQSRELEEAKSAVGVVAALAGRMRMIVEVGGEADHAGATRRGERRDALAAAAQLIVMAEELAAPDDAFVVTATRLLVEPNALSTIPGRARLWLDARAQDIAAVDAWRYDLGERAREIAAARRVEIRLTTASRRPGVRFDGAIRAALAEGARAVGVDAPEVVCFAGHDAGILGERIPAGMMLVRNPTGVSHSPAEEIAVADAVVAASAVARTLEALR